MSLRPQMKKRSRKAKAHVLSPAQKGEVSRLVNRGVARAAEHKFSLAGTGITFSAAYQIFPLFSIAQGLLDSNRVGDSITLKKVEVHYQIDRNVLNATYNERVRVVIFQWHPSSVSFPPVDTAFFLSDPVLGVFAVRSHYGPDYKRNFTILYDHVHTLVGLGTATSPNASNGAYCRFNLNLAPAKKKCQFIAGSATSVNDGLWIMVCGTTATNPSSLTYSTLTWFTDD